MRTTPSKSALLYDEVKQALLAGCYAPGQRIDPPVLARRFNASITPVRFALYRLVGEGLIQDHARDGFHVPLPSDLVLYDLYDWMQRLLMMAFDVGFATPRSGPAALDVPRPHDDLVLLTRRLFNNIAMATGRPELYRAIHLANDRLSPIRRAKQGLIEHAFEEVDRLNQHWQLRDVGGLRDGVQKYFERRKQLVPQIVASLSGAMPLALARPGSHPH